MFFHKELTKEKWQAGSFVSQMANIGAEIGRTMSWRTKDVNISSAAFDRGLELLELTITDKKNKDHLKELCNLREVLVDYFYFNNSHGKTDEEWNAYFEHFTYQAALEREKKYSKV